MNREDQFASVIEMVYDACMRTCDPGAFDGNVESDNFYEESPNVETQRFYDMLNNANELIYEGATESRLSIAIRLLAARTNWHVTKKCLDYFIQMLIDVVPKHNCIPKNYFEAKKIVSSLGLKAEKIDCCEDGCMLYYKADDQLAECKFCHCSRYLPHKGGTGRHESVPVKRMFYWSLIPRLQRLYASMETVKQMRWHLKIEYMTVFCDIHLMEKHGNTLTMYI